jgi:hypothetical protein
MMKNMMMTLMAVAAFALATGAQAQQAPTQAQTKAAVQEFLHRALKDPYSVRDLTIGTPVFNYRATKHKDWVIPIEFNSKNGFGAYTGIERHFVMWRDGGLDWAATIDRIQWEAFARGMQQASW